YSEDRPVGCRSDDQGGGRRETDGPDGGGRGRTGGRVRPGRRLFQPPGGTASARTALGAGGGRLLEPDPAAGSAAADGQRGADTPARRVRGLPAHRQRRIVAGRRAVRAFGRR